MIRPRTPVARLLSFLTVLFLAVSSWATPAAASPAADRHGTAAPVTPRPAAHPDTDARVPATPSRAVTRVPATPSRAVTRIPATPPHAVARIPAGDEVVTATADVSGYHLFAAGPGTGWRWKPLATLRPGGSAPDTGTGEPWIGEHCLTGDGRYVVAVVAPWSAQNSPAGFAAGGLAYAVDAHTGAVRPLLAGVSPAYFNPGCGSGSQAAFARFRGAGQARTVVLVADASTGVTKTAGDVAGELTSPVPAARQGVLAAYGRSVVRVDGSGFRPVVTGLPGQVYRLSVDAGGTLRFRTKDSATRTSFWQSAGGHTVLAAARPQDAVTDAGAETSHDGQVVTARTGARPGYLPLRRIADGIVLGGTLPAAAPATTTIPATAPVKTAAPNPPAKTAVRNTAPVKIAAPNDPHAKITAPNATPAKTAAQAATAAPAAWPPSPNTASPTCAVPRNNPAYQVRQPSSAMIEWATNQAGRGTGTFSGEFPLPAPFDGGAHVPREVLDGIMAQESNGNQASPHAPPGIPSNPYVADYYGSYASGTVDYNSADCGYGLGQVTDGMRLANPGDAPSQVQIDIATDYRANAARAAQILAQKWNELAGAGITVGQGDSGSIEDWYFAIWDYNSGLHPDDGQGNSGLGWANNPANPAYDPGRNPFLRDFNAFTGRWEESYGDAAHPAGWPYQEKVLGWIENPPYEPDGTSRKFAGTVDYLDQTGFLVQPAHTSFCSLAGNSCLPGLTGSGTCQRADFHCWWHEGWIGCVAGCHYGTATVPDGAPQPAVANPHPPVCDLSLPAGTVVVDDQPTDTNLVGCSPGRRGSGEFDVLYNTDPATGGQTGQIDWHQLGGGFGGHFWFTHTEPTGSKYAQTAYWRPGLALANYEVRVFVPDLGAVATGRYEIWPGGTSPATYVNLNQSSYGNQWVSLGTYELGPDGFVALSSETADGNGTVDLAFDAVAFVPVSAATVPYTAMGDSYSAGVGGDTYDPGTDTTSDQCRRSPDAYPRQFALTAGIGVNHVACSGATTANITGSGQFGEPRQLDNLPSTTSTVTITIGGNDAGFADVMTRCVTPLTGSCEDYYTKDDGNNLDRRIEALQAPLAAVYQAIRNRAPSARVIAVTYPNIFAPGSEGRTQSTCLNIGRIPDSDVAWLIDEIFHLDNVIDAAADQAGVHVLDERYALSGHELCTKDPWVNGLLTPPITDTGKAFHPTTAGQAQLAADLAADVNHPATITPVVWAGWRNTNLIHRMPTTAQTLAWLGRMTVEDPHNSAYDASYFGDWSTEPPSPAGCDRRTYVLERDADPHTTTLAPGSTCRINYGEWQSPYNDPAGPLNTVRGNPSPTPPAVSPVEVDHVVSKKDAWVSGADNWYGSGTDINQKRIDFANDIDNLELLSVSLRSNRQKLDRTPDGTAAGWTPDNSDAPGNPAFTCDFLKMYVQVKWQWELALTDDQFAFLKTRLGTCP